MKTHAVIFISAALTASAGCSGQHKSGDDAESSPTIDVAMVETDSVLLYKTYPGTLSSTDKANVVGRVNGTLATQNFNNGDNVRRGQVLFTISNPQYADAVQQAQSALTQAQSAYEYNSRNYEAMQRALQSEAVSQIAVLQAKNQMETSQAQIKNAQAALETARTNLGYCTVRAPFDGTMGLAAFSVGSYIGGEGSPVTLATIYDNSVVNVNFSIEDDSFLRMFTNDNNRSSINYDSVPLQFSEPLPHKYTCKLTFIAPSVDSGTGTLRLRGAVQNKYNELRDGMYATVSLPYKMDPQAILIKDAAISTDQLGKYVYVVNDSNKVVYTPIKIGNMANDSMRVVTEGLHPGQKYVTKALLKVRAGMEVNPSLTK